MNVNVANAKGFVALMHACQNGHDLCALALIKAGANVDHQNAKQWTALMFAAQNGHEQVCSSQLEYVHSFR